MAPGAEETTQSGSVTPVDLKLQLKPQLLTVQWEDGKTSEFQLGKLRAVCPCASCRQAREQANPLTILSADPADWRVVDARLVGNYAIQFFWSDGHNAGIFDFKYLRSLN